MGIYSRLVRTRNFYVRNAGPVPRRTPRYRHCHEDGTEDVRTPLIISTLPPHKHSLSCPMGCTKCEGPPFTKDLKRRTPRCKRCGGGGKNDLLLMGSGADCHRCRGTGFAPR